MGRFIIRRFIGMLAVLLVVSLITFGLMHAVPGGPFDREKPLPAATIALLNEKYNLDAPLFEQYLDYIGDIIGPRLTYGRIPPSQSEDYLINVELPFITNEEGQGAAVRWINFGPTYSSRSLSVNDRFRENLPISFQLGMAAFAVALVIGLPSGIIAALNRNSGLDYLSMSIALIGVSVPVIVTAPVLQYIFSVQLRILPVTGWGTLQQMILPSLALGFANSAIVARLTRASILQVLNEDFIRTARAKGLSERIVVIVHVLKNSLIPIVTVMGPLFAALVTGTFVVETVFGIPGMGRFFVTSIQSRDYPVIMGTVLLYAGFLVAANTFVDVLYAWIDPRIRLD